MQPVTLCILPLYHIYALNVTMTSTLHIGGQLVMLPKFEPKSFINALEKYKPTFLHLAPPLLAFCADHEGVRPDALKHMHHVMCAAAPTGANLVKRFQKKVPGCLVKEGMYTIMYYIRYIFFKSRGRVKLCMKIETISHMTLKTCYLRFQ